MRQSSIYTQGLCIVCITMVMGLSLVSNPGYAQELGQVGRTATGRTLERQIGAHDQVALADADPVDRQLAQYARQVPEMGFVRLYGEKGTHFARKLLSLLGEGAINLDYEHDASLSSALMQLQLNRIGIMVTNGIPSATLFKVGKGSIFEHPYLCVISLDPVPFRKDPHYAGRFLTSDFDLENPVFDDRVLIENEGFLKFAVDHEVFHCLDAYFNGPQIKKTSDAIYGHYQHYVNEARADAFASQAFKRDSAEPDKFLKTLAALRTLSLLEFDLHHFTGDVILRSLIGQPLSSSQTLEQRVGASRELVEEIAPSPNGYGVRMANTARLMGELGRDPDEFLLKFKGHQLPPHDESKVLVLLDEVRKAQSMLEKDSIPR